MWAWRVTPSCLLITAALNPGPHSLTRRWILQRERKLCSSYLTHIWSVFLTLFNDFLSQSGADVVSLSWGAVTVSRARSISRKPPAGGGSREHRVSCQLSEISSQQREVLSETASESFSFLKSCEKAESLRWAGCNFSQLWLSRNQFFPKKIVS